MDRREFIRRGSLAILFGAIGTLSFFEAAAKLESPSQTATPKPLGGGAQTPSLQAPSGYVYVANVSALAGKSSAYFNHPTAGSSILVNFGGQWRAFSAICTHAGCLVSFTGSSIYCPCHAGYFSPTNGSVQRGPPPSPLPEYGVIINGSSLYVSQSRIN